MRYCATACTVGEHTMGVLWDVCVCVCVCVCLRKRQRASERKINAQEDEVQIYDMNMYIDEPVMLLRVKYTHHWIQYLTHTTC